MPLAPPIPPSSLLIRPLLLHLSKPKPPLLLLPSIPRHYHALKRPLPSPLSHSIPHFSPFSSTASALAQDPAPTLKPNTSKPKPNKPTPAAPATAAVSTSAKKKLRSAPESVLRHKLDMCSKRGDLEEALQLYDEARAAATPLFLHHFNVLLYLCSLSNGDGFSELGLSRGFEIFRQMEVDGVVPNEATFTSLARLAAAKEDPDLAFDLVKRMAAAGIPPKLRSFGPALFGFCKKGEVERAHEVEAYMDSSGVQPEDAELAAILEVNVEKGRGGDVYRVMHRLRSAVRRVSESTAEISERWFGSAAAAKVGAENWDVGKVNEGLLEGGGGWHGQGWLGKGPWSVGRTTMDSNGVCQRCEEKLVCIDIDPVETEGFANSVGTLACQREARAGFTGFQEWLSRHGPFDAVIDGANVGMNNQQVFNFYQLKSVVNGMREMSPSKKLPLIILHSRRTKEGPASDPRTKKMLDAWRNAGALYATPPGSNDDWYWLYAAVKSRSLLVTNDEMRDHLFELLGKSFFPRWKEKHQVRFTFARKGINFHLPPPYSIVIQESACGSWHIPTESGDDIEAPRQWVCAVRGSNDVSPSSQSQGQIH